MATFISVFLFLIFLFIALIHIYWAFGGKWASDSVLPTKEDNLTPVLKPSVIPTLIVAFGLLGFGLFILFKAGLLNLNIPFWLNKYGLWIIFGIFALRFLGDFKYVGFFKKIKQTKFGKNDSKYFSPLCLIIALFSGILIYLG